MRGEADTLLKVLNTFQGMHYIDRMRHIPSQEAFARGWFSRVGLSDLGLDADERRVITDFDQVFTITMGHEGGYSNHPADIGGETYKGISRVYHPGWVGWAIVDAWTKAVPTRDEDWLATNERLQRYVVEFYKAQFWDTWRGDDVLAIDGQVAEELFDTGVNMGVQRAVGFLQKALNVLNRQGQSWPDLEEDGLMGPKTLDALKVCCVT